MNDGPLLLDGHRLTLAEARRVAHAAGSRVEIAPPVREAVRRCRGFVEGLVRSGDSVYGVNTGFGRLREVAVPREQLRVLQRNLLRSHAVGVGPAADPPLVRLQLLYRLNTLLRGHSGIREEVVDLLADLLREDVLPVIPLQGSVGASGDLAPLAHLALVLQGEGECDAGGVRLPGREALARVGRRPLDLEAKEGLALINGTQFTAAVGTLGIERAWRLAATADVALAMTVDALTGSTRPFDARVAALRPHRGHGEAASNARRLLAGSRIVDSHRDCGRVQDPYSLRCAPQVHGAARDALRHATRVLVDEINAVTDNPLLFPDDGDSVSAGNFHAEPLGLPLDYAAIAVAELASIAERRLEQLVNPDLSGLPAFLAGGDVGLNSGLMIVQVMSASLVSENKVLCHPASVDSIPTSANQEDHVSMAPIAARKLRDVAENATHVIASELLAGFLALHHRRPLRSGAGVEAAFSLLERHVGPPGTDRDYRRDVLAVAALVADGSVVAAVEDAVGPLERGLPDGAP